jgi:3',5'-cyclic AMP phosphodiesterase CpdA
VVGWLLERLEQDVPAFGDPLDLVDDEHLAPKVRRRRDDRAQQLADVVDPVVRRRVELGDVERTTLPDRDARRAFVARLAVAEVRAVERLRDDPGDGRLASPARTDEQEGMGYPFGSDGVPEGRDDRLLADDLAERLGAPAPVEGLMCWSHERASGRRLSERRLVCRAPSVDLDAPAPTVPGGSDQADPRHPTIIA